MLAPLVRPIGSVHAAVMADPEVSERPKRRRFSAEYKLAILREVDTVTEEGQITAILRRERLYSSHLVDWRRARDRGALAALARPSGRPRPNPEPHWTEPVKPDETRGLDQLCAGVSFGGLIQAGPGSRGGSGRLLTNRSGWAA